jgi:hypothetical protein
MRLITTILPLDLREEIASRIGQDHVAHGLVIPDVAGATAQVTVERLGNRLLEIWSRHRLLRQTLQQNLALVEKAGGAISTLKREMLNESFLQNRKLAVLRMPSTVRMALPLKFTAGTTQVGMV